MALRTLNEFITTSRIGPTARRLYAIRTRWTPMLLARWSVVTPPSSESITADAPLHEEEIEAEANEDDEEHDGGNRRAHGRIAELELIAKEGAIEKRAENV